MAVGVAVAGAVIGAIGLVTQTVGQVQAGRAANRQSDYQATVARQNAKFYREEAAYAEAASTKLSQDHFFKVESLFHEQRATQGASGFVVGSGTFQTVLADTLILGELDAANIRAEGSKEARRNLMLAGYSEDQAAMIERSKINPYINAVGSFASGATGIIANYSAATR